MAKENMMAVVRLNFEPRWLALSRDERRAYAELIEQILARHPEVSFRWFDADALGSGYTDFAICEFEELTKYHFLWEELKDTDLFTKPYASITDVTLGIEQGYRAYEQQVA